QGTDLSGPRLRATEGPMKADICAVRSDIPTVALPSAGAWTCFADLLRELPHVTQVLVALDADFRTNPMVAQALQRLLNAIVDLGREARLEVWDGMRAKGIDDALVADVPITVLDPQVSIRIAHDACAAPGAGHMAVL